MVYPEINLQSGVPIYPQLKASFRRMAALGLIKAHDQLPSVRQLASELGINPNTVQKAYGEMEQENLIYAVPGKGNYLSDIPENKELEETATSAQPPIWPGWPISSEELHTLLMAPLEVQSLAERRIRSWHRN